MSGSAETDIENLLDAARELGTEDPEEEINALQELLRAAWNLMTEAQQTTLMQTDEAQAVLEPEEDEDAEEPDE
jgi:hypothetical protein